ncbi:MAG: autotransporter domain-containing protein [Deltaproteobacteria bacterium]|jgi:outer membrane autotransporter protein|nr:autotransporter domain-containing protein [Deltaproteobacteria bacterium]
MKLFDKTVLGLMTMIISLLLASSGYGANVTYNTSQVISSPVNASLGEKVEILRGAEVNLSSIINITDVQSGERNRKSVYILEGSTLNILSNGVISTFGEFQLEGGPNGQNTTVNLFGNAKILVNGDGTRGEEGYFGLDMFSRNATNGEDGRYLTEGYNNRGQARVVVADGANASINANQAFAITRNSELELKNNANLTIDALVPWSGGKSNITGMFVVGQYVDFKHFVDVDGNSINAPGAPESGGSVKIGPNSNLKINSPFILFGSGSNLEMADSSALLANGSVYLSRGHNRGVGQSGNFSVGKLTVSDGLTIDSGRFEFNGPLEVNNTTDISDSVVYLNANSMFSDGDEDEATHLFSSDIHVAPGVTMGFNSEINLGGTKPSNLYIYGGTTLDGGSLDGEIVLGWAEEKNAKGNLIVDTKNSSPANINNLFAIHIENGQLLLKEGSVLDISFKSSAYPSFSGVLGLGDIDGDNIIGDMSMTYPDGSSIPPYDSPNPRPYFAGSLLMEKGSSLRVDGRAYFARASTVDVGQNTLTITGDTWFKKGSTLILEATSSGKGKIQIEGKTTIEPGAAVTLSGAYSLNDVILSSAGGFTADSAVFDNLIYDLAFNNNDLVIYDFSGAEEILEGGSGSGGAGNIQAAAVVIIQLIQDGGPLADKLVATLQTIAQLSPSQADLAIKQLIGVNVLESIGGVKESLQQDSSALGRRMAAIRTSSLAPAAGYGSAQEHLWVAGFGSWARQKDTPNFSGYSYDSSGVIVGFDHEVSSAPGLTLGVTGSFSKGKLKNNDHLSKSDVDNYSFGIYGVYEAANGFFIEGNIGYGRSNNDLETRHIINEAISKGNFDSDNFQTGFNVGYVAKVAENINLIPSAGLQYIRIENDSWYEKLTGGNELNTPRWFGDSKMDFLEIPVSLKLETTQRVGGVILTPEIHVGAVFVANNPKNQMRVGFAGPNGPVHNLQGLDPGKNRFQGGASLKLQVSDLVDIFATYELEKRSKFTSHYGHIGVGFSF